jgi:predicted ATPase with chaperone activity
MMELGLICPGCQGGEAAWAGSVEVLAGRVAAARAAQRQRGGETGPFTNAEADGAKVQLMEDARVLAEQAVTRLGLSPRGFTRVLRVARTIADLARSPSVRKQDIAEALAFRQRIPGRDVVLRPRGSEGAGTPAQNFTRGPHWA